MTGRTTVLVTINGLPATGKTTLCRELVRRIGAVHVRIDTIEQALVDSGTASHPVGPVGYDIAYALTADFLRQGHIVLAESVNPLPITRDSWRVTARRVGVPVLDVEVVCTDPAEHRRRAEHRSIDIPGLTPPTWQQIQDRDYQPWDIDHVVLDTTERGAEDCAEEIAVLITKIREQGS